MSCHSMLMSHSVLYRVHPFCAVSWGGLWVVSLKNVAILHAARSILGLDCALELGRPAAIIVEPIAPLVQVS